MHVAPTYHIINSSSKHGHLLDLVRIISNACHSLPGRSPVIYMLGVTRRSKVHAAVYQLIQCKVVFLSKHGHLLKLYNSNACHSFQGCQSGFNKDAAEVETSLVMLAPTSQTNINCSSRTHWVAGWTCITET